METETNVQEVESTEGAAPNNDDLFGDSTGSTNESEPEQQAGTDEPSGDDSEAAPGEAEAQTETAETATETEDEAEIELPVQQSKTYSDALRADYAKRFGWSLDDLASDKGKAFAVKKAIDGDIYLKQLESKLSDFTATDAEEEEEEPETAGATDAQATDQQAQYDKFVSQLSSQVIRPEYVEKYGKSIALAMLGTDPDKIEDPDQKAEALAFVARGSAMAKAILPGLVDLVETMMPQRMEAYLESAIPGFQRDREIQEAAGAWEALRKNPEFAHFPAYGTRDSEYGKFIQENAAKIPNFQGMVFNDPKTGRALPRALQVAAKLELIAQVASGKRATPEVVKQAAQTAKKQVEEQRDKKTAAKALGAGNSKSQITPKKTGNDDIFGEEGEFSSKRIGY